MVPGGRKPLGQSLVEEGHLSPEGLSRALEEQRRTGAALREVLLRLELVPESAILDYYENQLGFPRMDLTTYVLEPEIVRLVPERVARQFHVVPLFKIGSTITVAMADPLDVVALDEIKQSTGLTVDVVISPESQIREAVDRHHPLAGIDRLSREQGLKQAVAEIAAARPEEDGPIIRFVNAVVQQALRDGASDVHIEPEESSFRIRFRVDGVLREVSLQAKALYASIVSRVKVMATLDIAERRLPQDGRIKLRYGAREIDFRVSILPTIFGEKAVLRILDKESLQLDLTKLGFDPWSYEKFSHAIHQPYGMVLITGPTGSGKTTSLYSAIATINSPEHNIMTAEDPVEYNLKGVNQVQINDEIGRTFAGALRAFLRQDPDVILVGETRDLETAQIGIRAALTGHLVLTTLHTNDCPSTVARLLDMGIPPFLVSSSLMLILAQRLGRRVCKECKEPYEADEETLVPYGHVSQGLGKVNFYKGKGCATCSFTGMKGRVAIYEVMPATQEIRDLIIRNAPSVEIGETAQAQGMKTLRQNALQKVLDGMMTVEEVLRVTLG
jgi:type IV pilus assembly protein PilB